MAVGAWRLGAKGILNPQHHSTHITQRMYFIAFTMNSSSVHPPSDIYFGTRPSIQNYPLYRWPADKFRLHQKVILSDLWERFNTVKIPLQDSVAFHGDVLAAANRAESRDQFYAYLAESREGRYKELRNAMSETGSAWMGRLDEFPSEHPIGDAICQKSMLDFVRVVIGVVFGWDKVERKPEGGLVQPEEWEFDVARAEEDEWDADPPYNLLDLKARVAEPRTSNSDTKASPPTASSSARVATVSSACTSFSSTDDPPPFLDSSPLFKKAPFSSSDSTAIHTPNKPITMSESSLELVSQSVTCLLTPPRESPKDCHDEEHGNVSRSKEDNSESDSTSPTSFASQDNIVHLKTSLDGREEKRESSMPHRNATGIERSIGGTEEKKGEIFVLRGNATGMKRSLDSTEEKEGDYSVPRGKVIGTKRLLDSAEEDEQTMSASKKCRIMET